VQLGPRFHQPLLPPGKRTSDQLDWVDSEDCDLVLVVRVEMRRTVSLASLCIHPDDDTEEPGDLRHACPGSLLQILDSRADQAAFTVTAIGT
jgi:hypothetical protein